MSTPRPVPVPTVGSPPRTFVLYVEGARDRGLVEAWARSVSRPLATALSRVTVILGGCRPARAAEHFRGVRASDGEARALCLLDRDRDGAQPSRAATDEPGLAFYTWGRRHIESYRLVPGAIRRSLRIPARDARVERVLRAAIPADDEALLREVDAKALFARHGVLARALGRPVWPARVARAMQPDELHADVLDLLGRLRAGLGIPEPQVRARWRLD